MPNVRIVLKNGDHTVEIETSISEDGYAKHVADIALGLWQATDDEEPTPRITTGFQLREDRKGELRRRMYGEFRQPHKVYDQDQ